MRQEVRVLLQLTLDIDAKLTKKEIERNVKLLLSNDSMWYLGIDSPVEIDIIEVREEAEIYGTEEESPAMQEYYEKYKIDRKRQTKLDL